MDTDKRTEGLMSDDEFARRFFETDLSDLGSSASGRGEGRHPLVMVVVMAFSAILMWMFFEDTRYYFEPSSPTDFGDTMRFRKAHTKNPAHRPPGLAHNTYVRIRGLTAFRAEALESKQAFLKMAYVPVYVHLVDEEPSRPSDTLVHLSVSGRLLDMTLTSEYRRIQKFYADSFGVPTRRAFMVVAGDKPGDYWWTLPLQGLFALFILLNGGMLFRSMKA